MREFEIAAIFMCSVFAIGVIMIVFDTWKEVKNGTNVNNVMDEFYFENPDAFVVAVYKMLERDWGYKKK